MRLSVYKNNDYRFSIPKIYIINKNGTKTTDQQRPKARPCSKNARTNQETDKTRPLETKRRFPKTKTRADAETGRLHRGLQRYVRL
jgi:hypothetical protein